MGQWQAWGREQQNVFPLKKYENSLLNIKLRKNVNTIHLLTPDMYPRLILITPSCPYDLPLRVPRLLFHLDKNNN